MATLRDIRRRINSVKSTQQITKAMKMVAAAKLRKAQDRLFDTRPYASRLRKLIAHVAADESRPRHPLLETREVKSVGYVVVSSDRGLCGSFNANVIRQAKARLDELSSELERSVVAVGRKAADFFGKRDYRIVNRHINIFDMLDFAHAVDISSAIQRSYQEGGVDEVYVVYNSFKSAGAQLIRVDKLLPVEPEVDSEERIVADYIYEPSAENILQGLLPKNLNIQIWRVLLESYASEQGARMVAMDSATENANEMIYDLTLYYNKVRQASITTEISEIVGGAEALKG